MGKYKATIIVILVYDSIFNFLQDLKGKCIKIIIIPSYQEHMYKEVICNISNITGKMELSTSGVFVHK